MLRYPDKSNRRYKGLILTCTGEAVHPEGRHASRKLSILSSVDRQGEKNAHLQLLFSIFLSPGPKTGIEPHMDKVGFPIPINLI